MQRVSCGRHMYLPINEIFILKGTLSPGTFGLHLCMPNTPAKKLILLSTASYILFVFFCVEDIDAWACIYKVY